MGLLDSNAVLRERRAFMALVREGGYATTATVRRDVEAAGDSIEPGVTTSTIATAVPVIAEKVASVTRRDSEVLLSGRAEAGQWNIMFPVDADITWASGIAASAKSLFLNDKITLADGTALRVVSEPVNAMGHQELVAGQP